MWVADVQCRSLCVKTDIQVQSVELVAEIIKAKNMMIDISIIVLKSVQSTWFHNSNLFKHIKPVNFIVPVS